MSLFQYGDFILASKQPSKFKIDCDYLTGVDLRMLAYIGSRLVPAFGGVWGVPRGGLLFAEALRGYTCPTKPWLLVDDVLTTGGSMERMREQLGPNPNGETMGLVIFARGPCPSWIKAIFQMAEIK